MAAQNSQGIQILFEAEKEADKIVERGREYRIRRLKEAKAEAEKELGALRLKKGDEFAQFEAQFTGTSDQLISQEDALTQERTEASKAAFAEKRELLIRKLLDAVMDVQPVLHVNARQHHP